MGGVAILASGDGSNAQALMAASGEGALGPGKVVVVFSDRPDAGVLERARRGGVEALHIPPARFDRREEYDQYLRSCLEERAVQYVCLAGFMRILSPSFVDAFENRILNVHPSLLPAFPGAHAVRDCLGHGVRVTGATVHFVDEGIDTGPIVLQEAVVVAEGDDEVSLHSRIKDVEHRIYPRALNLLASGRLSVRGRRVIISDGQGFEEFPAEARSVP